MHNRKKNAHSPIDVNFSIYEVKKKDNSRFFVIIWYFTNDFFHADFQEQEFFQYLSNGK